MCWRGLLAMTPAPRHLASMEAPALSPGMTLSECAIEFVCVSCLSVALLWCYKMLSSWKLVVLVLLISKTIQGMRNILYEVELKALNLYSSERCKLRRDLITRGH